MPEIYTKSSNLWDLSRELEVQLWLWFQHPGLPTQPKPTDYQHIWRHPDKARGKCKASAAKFPGRCNPIFHMWTPFAPVLIKRWKKIVSKKCVEELQLYLFSFCPFISIQVCCHGVQKWMYYFIIFITWQINTYYTLYYIAFMAWNIHFANHVIYI